MEPMIVFLLSFTPLSHRCQDVIYRTNGTLELPQFETKDTVPLAVSYLEGTSVTCAWPWLALACFRLAPCGPEKGFSGHKIPSNRIHLSLSSFTRGLGVWWQDVYWILMAREEENLKHAPPSRLSEEKRRKKLGQVVRQQLLSTLFS